MTEIKIAGYIDLPMGTLVTTNLQKIKNDMATVATR